MCGLALGGLAGFLTSAGLLEAGLSFMAWRYGLAALVGYGVFLLGLRLWLTLHGRGRPKLEDAGDALDLVPAPIADTGAASGVAPEFQFGGGGGFSGGGAGGPLDGAGISEAASPAEVVSGASGAADVAAVSALDEAAAVVIPVLIVGFIVVGLVGVVTVVVGAPGLLAGCCWMGSSPERRTDGSARCHCSIGCTGRYAAPGSPCSHSRSLLWRQAW